MKPLVDSLYLRLALVLLASLGTGFATMYAVFLSHSDENRMANLARTIAVQVRLVEEVLRSHPDFDRNPGRGIVLADAPGHAKKVGAEQELFLTRLHVFLDAELMRTPAIRHAASGADGFWIRLANVPQGERWLYFPRPRRHKHVEPWTWGLWTSFLVVLIGGMALLWGVNKPLRRLERAIDQVGRVDSPLVDISGPKEIRHLAEQFNQMVLRLKQYDQDRAEMLAGVAHDLRAPITRLRLQVEMENTSRRDAMIGNLDGVDAIVSQFLLFARGVDPEKPERRPLHTFLEEVVAPYLSRGVSFEVKQMQAPQIELDIMPTLLRRAVTNLLENAIEYGSMPVIVGYELRSGEAVIRVSDCGPGIPPEKLDLATKAFTRLDSARSGTGHCGLGLAIVARITKLHQGRLQFGRAHPSGLVAEIIFSSVRDGF